MYIKRILENTRFIMGIRTNRISMVKKSILNGADINSRDIRGNSALHMVIERRNITMLKILITNDVDLNFRKSEEYTPIEYACIYGNARIVKELVQAGCNLNYDKNEICQILAARNRVYTLKYLIDSGMRSGQKGWDGRTGLHWAAQESCFEIVKFLVEKGADVNTMDKEGQTPLRIACGEGNLEITEFLLDNHANVDLGIDDTPLLIASSMGYTEIVCLLLKYGAKVNWRDKDGRTALFFAKAYKRRKIEKVLERYGADTGIVDKYGISIKDLEIKEMRKKAVWEI